LLIELENFLCKSSRVIERALEQSEKYDIMVDYGADENDMDTFGDDTTQILKQLHIFSDKKWTKYRAVTDIDLSPYYEVCG